MNNSQLSLLDPLTHLAEAEKGWLRWARSYAKSFALLHHSVTSDDIRAEADRVDLQPNSHHSWGCLWKESGWRVISREPSKIASNNKRWINRYQWEGL